MFRHCLAATLRHLSRNRAYSAIGILSLAVGIWAALMAALTIHDQLSHDHFIPGHERIYLVETSWYLRGGGVRHDYLTGGNYAALLKARFPEVQATTRLSPEKVSLRRGIVNDETSIYWADPNAADVLPLPVIAGDLAATLQRPDGIALTRAMARKYFGRDAPVGETLLLTIVADPHSEVVTGASPPEAVPHPMVVGAVLEDIPAQSTQFETGIFASGRAAFSALSRIDGALQSEAPPVMPGQQGNTMRSSARALGNSLNYVRLAPGARADDLRSALHDLTFEALGSDAHLVRLIVSDIVTRLIRLDRVNAFPGLNPQFANKMLMTWILGALALAVGVLNFVNLLTARALQRAPEVGIRKLAGAGRGLLMLQFLGESVLYVAIATVVAVALTEWSLPYVNAYLGSAATFRYWRDPWLAGGILCAAVALALIAGVWPALKLSSFQVSAAAVRSGRRTGGGFARQLLVALQFAILIGLVIAAATVQRQRQYATREALRFDADQVLIVRSSCNAAFSAELRKLPGVRAAVCSGAGLVEYHDSGTTNVSIAILLGPGQDHRQMMPIVVTDLAAFDLYGVQPIAGRIETSGVADGTPGGTDRRLVLNESGARKLGFTSPQAAIGQLVQNNAGIPGVPANAYEVVAVIPDILTGSIERRIEGMGYSTVPLVPVVGYDIINVKLSGQDVPETLAAIDDLWRSTGGSGPIRRTFLDEQIQRRYVDLLRQAQVFSIISLVTVLLAGVGLLGLAASLAEQRTREIGIRKALGANTGDVLKLLLWQFSKPVVWANLIAWPVAGYYMSRWLAGFAYRIDLPLWLFPAAGLLAVLIALATVTAHSLRVAGARPVVALRYE